MFCYQCEQTAHGIACVEKSICGKTEDVAVLQDLLIHATKGISQYAHRAAQLGVRDPQVDRFAIEALFTTVTNVNFDPARMVGLLRRAAEMRDRAKRLYQEASVAAGKAPVGLAGPATWAPAADDAGLQAQGRTVSILGRINALGADAAGLQELLTYGIKGAAAYAEHAAILGKEDPVVYAFFHEALDFLTDPAPTVDALVAMNLKCGEISLRVLALLDSANTGAYGNPVPTKVLMGHVPGKAILVSGHDLKDLDELLKQTAGKGINVYTHGEMLPAHGYPELKKHPHLVGHYGGAWQKQAAEFDRFPGAILMTTNCLQRPRESYQARIFTSGLVAWPGVAHIGNRDFSAVIEAALDCRGFVDASPVKTHHVGFGHHAVLGVADTVIDAVKTGAIKRFVLIGGCDGAEPGRNYYTELAETMPKDWVVLTLGCGKFRVVDCDLGEIGGLPRLLDMGQCNDSFSAIRVAVALAEAFGTDVNSLPLNLVLSWYEQKAICVLLALLHLGVKNIRVGPKLPAFVTPAVLKVLVDTFNIMPITTVRDDLEAMQPGVMAAA
ncbi:hydroxylamine reductase [Shumkonia mesophila]|uniref:hydroxylamine reductase n=1 Tax=Shumkonia mesophila TaxID=2838854 RepID=UPI002934B76E|nr:hydroxylamine reductase [Shumkonia mesophila]